MADIENSPDYYKTLKTSNGTIIKNHELIKFTPDHFKTIKMSKNIVKKLICNNVCSWSIKGCYKTW